MKAITEWALFQEIPDKRIFPNPSREQWDSFICWIYDKRGSSSSPRKGTLIILINGHSFGTPPLNDGVKRYEMGGVSRADYFTAGHYAANKWLLFCKDGRGQGELKAESSKHFPQPIDNDLHLFNIGCLGFPFGGRRCNPGFRFTAPGPTTFQARWAWATSVIRPTFHCPFSTSP